MELTKIFKFDSASYDFECFSELIARRYEKNSTIIMTNQPFSKWADIFSYAERLTNVTFDIERIEHFCIKTFVHFNIDIFTKAVVYNYIERLQE